MLISNTFKISQVSEEDKREAAEWWENFYMHEQACTKAVNNVQPHSSVVTHITLYGGRIDQSYSEDLLKG